MYTQKILFVLLLVMSNAFSLFAQSGEIEMATEFRQSGKIYVVVAVLVVIFIGIIAYLISLDRKIGKLEKQLQKEDKISVS